MNEPAILAAQAKERETIWQRLRIPISIAFAVCGLFAVAVSGSYWSSRSAVFASVLMGVGVVLAAIGGFGRVWCSVYAAGFKNKVLITEGPYSMCRNPLYFFSLTGALGIGLTTQTLTVPLVILAVFAIYYPLVIKGESQILRGIHGTAYDEYVAKVPTFFPKRSGLAEPSKYEVRPKVIRRHIGSAIWFLWIIALIVLFAGMRQDGVLPTLFTIY